MATERECVLDVRPGMVEAPSTADGVIVIVVAKVKSTADKAMAGALHVEAFQAHELCVRKDPRLAAVQQHRCHDHLVEHPCHRGGYVLLLDDFSKAAPHRAGAGQLSPRGEDIRIVVRD